MLNDTDMAILSATQTEQEWNDACDNIKRKYGGYPSNWFEKVLKSGFLAHVASQWQEK